MGLNPCPCGWTELTMSTGRSFGKEEFEDLAMMGALFCLATCCGKNAGQREGLRVMWFHAM